MSNSITSTSDRPQPRSVNEVNWDTWKFTEEAVLCFIRSEERLLLIHKKTGLGKGKVNAPGGRIEKGEKPRDAAVRETVEETHVIPLDPEFVAELQFIFTDGYSLKGLVYFASRYEGTPTETDEADPFWCPVDSIPYEKMWADDIHWLPRVLRGEKVRGRFIFEGDRMLDLEVEGGAL